MFCEVWGWWIGIVVGEFGFEVHVAFEALRVVLLGLDLCDRVLL